MTASNTCDAGFSIKEKIEAAHALFRNWGDRLLTDPFIRELMARVDLKIAASGKAMLEVGILSACRRCEEDEGGSCCGAGIENKYDVALLAVNLLMGETLAAERRFPASCFFLGSEGCTLKARHTLCVNFFCVSVQKALALDDLVRVQKTIGDEMVTTFLLIEAVKKYIRDRSDPTDSTSSTSR
jgi:hypothetical protein